MENEIDIKQTPSDVELASSNNIGKVVELYGGGDMDASDYRDTPDTSPIDAPTNTHDIETAPIDASADTIEIGTVPLYLPVYNDGVKGFQNPDHKFFWHGKDIIGTDYIGSGNDSSQCNVDAGLLGSSTCHLSINPDYIEPEVIKPVVETPPTPSELNKFYSAGYADGIRYFDDIKALILAWATEQQLFGGVADVDALPFVIYARYNP